VTDGDLTTTKKLQLTAKTLDSERKTTVDLQMHLTTMTAGSKLKSNSVNFENKPYFEFC